MVRQSESDLSLKMDFAIILGLLLCYLYQTNDGAVRFCNGKNATFETIELQKVRNNFESNYGKFQWRADSLFFQLFNSYADWFKCIFFPFEQINSRKNINFHKKNQPGSSDLNIVCKILILGQLDPVILIVLSETTKNQWIPGKNIQP